MLVCDVTAPSLYPSSHTLIPSHSLPPILPSNHIPPFLLFSPHTPSHHFLYSPLTPHRLQRVVTAKDALVKDLKSKVEAFQERESKAQAAAAAKLAKENAKSKDSWKIEKEKESSDVRGDSKAESKSPRSVPPFGGGPTRSETPLRSALGSSAYTTSASASASREKREGKKEVVTGFDVECVESEILSASAHLSASELRIR